MAGSSDMIILAMMILAVVVALMGLVLMSLRERSRRISFRQVFHNNNIQSQPKRSDLDPKTLDRLFPAYQMAHESGSCAVCLAAIGDQEFVRRLKCEHTYHRECIDTWLLSRSRRPNCPLCRKVLSTSFESSP
mmetsp:Transcript_148933/g.478547  ORF Transcript_148933/g.478547 Transcript_148933/m.478547 type:complete len:133 (-) Transcript_148933:513-911(-)